MITNTSLFWFLLNLYILYYRRQFVIFRTACYSIKQRSKHMLFCCCNGLTSKHSNSFLIVFIVWRQFICFVFARQILMFLPYSLGRIYGYYIIRIYIYTANHKNNDNTVKIQQKQTINTHFIAGNIGSCHIFLVRRRYI